MISIKLIWSTDPNDYIGYKDNLIWSCKKDFNHFSSVTTGFKNNAIVMGRKTHESIGSILPNRLNIILTKDKSYQLNQNDPNITDACICHSIREVIEHCEQHNINILWVIGGKEIYEQFIELADEVVVTHYDQYTPLLKDLTQFTPDLSDFTEYLSDTYTDIDKQTGYKLTFTVSFKRRNLCV